MKHWFVTLLIINFFICCTNENYLKFGLGEVRFSEHKWTMKVEVAKTKQQIETGLMFRKSLLPNQGMLFVFEQEMVQRVWMKNTLIPLDIVFFSAQAEVVSTINNLQPCLKKSCDIFNSMANAKYMLEMNAGTIEKKKIKKGQKVVFQMTLR